MKGSHFEMLHFVVPPLEVEVPDRRYDKAIAALKGLFPDRPLAWVMVQGENIVPIPGTRRRARLDENLGAAGVDLTPGDIEEIARALAQPAKDMNVPNRWLLHTGG